MKHVLLGLAACSLTLSVTAQQLRCGTDLMRAKRIAADPTYLEREAAYQEEIGRLMLNSADFRDRAVVVTIPIVFHIIHLGGDENITNEQILNEMVLLNQDYSATNPDISQVHPAFQDFVGNAEVRFELPTLDPDGNCTNGIDRIRTPETNVGNDGSKMNPWPRDKYLNVWVVNRMGDEGVAGYAYYPGTFEDPLGRLADGVILLNDYVGEIGTANPNRSTALTHEIGHYLNLPHVWGNNNGVEDPTTPAPPGHMVPECGDDNVEDTPVTRGWEICPENRNDWTDDCNNLPLDTLVYEFEDVTTTSGTTDPSPLENAFDVFMDEPRTRLVVGPFSASGVSSNSTEPDRFAFSSWGDGPFDGETNYANLTGAIDLSKYYSFTLDPEVTDVLTVDSIGFLMGRDASGVRTFAVRSSANNYVTNLPIRAGGNPAITVMTGNVAFYNTDATVDVPTIYVDPPVNGHTNLDQPLTFRIYGWNAENENGTLRICSNAAPVDLFDNLGGAPQTDGTWSGPSPTTGSFDPATMQAGDYTYTFGGPCATMSATVTVIVNDPPSAPVISGASSTCAGTNVTLTSSTTTGIVWSPGGQISPTINTSTANIYSVTATDGNGCKSTSDPFEFTVVPQANAGGNDSLTVCETAGAVPLFNSLTGAPQDGGAWSGPSPVIDGLYDPASMTPGAYIYVITATAPCLNDTATVHVVHSATANAGTNGTLTICSNAAPADLFDRLGGRPQADGTWTGPSEMTGSYDPPTMAPGVYTYAIDAGSPCGAATATVTVTENAPPNQPSITGASSLCAGSTITLTSSSPSGNLWSTGGINPTIQVSAAGTYSVTVTATGCSSTSGAFVVSAVPKANAGGPGQLTVCTTSGAVPLGNSLQGLPDAGGAWTGPSPVTDGLYDAASMEPGDYVYTVTGTAPCPNASATITVSENDDLSFVSGTFEVDNVVVYGNSGLIENVQNYMEYSYCSNMFSIGQVERMRAALNSTTGERSNLWSEANLQATGVGTYAVPCAPIADFYVRTVPIGTGSQEIPFSPTVCVNTDVQFIDNSMGGLPTGWSWTFEGGNPATSSARNPIVSFDSPGFKNVSLTVSNANGSDTKTTPYSILVGGSPNDFFGFYQEGFEDNDGLFPWLDYNYADNITNFQRTTATAFTGNACAVLNSGVRNQLDLIDPANEDDIDDLISPTFNLDNLINGTLSFRYAYSTGTNMIDLVTERLDVTSSTDCGETWTLLPGGNITGADLINNGNNPELPPPAWTLVSFNLSQSRLVPNVRFRFRYTSSAFSGNLYIDDINISGSVGIEDLSPEFFMSLYPNPTNDQFSLAVYGMDRFSTDIIVTDIRGAQVYRTTHRPAGTAGIQFSGRELGLSDGMYMIRATNEAGNSTQKLVIGK